MTIANVLKTIIHHKETHARWLNSLSYLEYRGFRKIVKSRSTDDMSYQVLMHTAEEVRHALFFKKKAIFIGGKNFENYKNLNLLCSDAIKSYFYQLDLKTTLTLKVKKEFEKEIFLEASYFLVTWLIEKRALFLYQIYHDQLKISSAPFSLSSILREENLHLEEIGKTAEQFLLNHGFDTNLFTEIEENEFQKLWFVIENQVSLQNLEHHSRVEK